jgi:FtsH-binding integral membrane protein
VIGLSEKSTKFINNINGEQTGNNYIAHTQHININEHKSNIPEGEKGDLLEFIMDKFFSGFLLLICLYIVFILIKLFVKLAFVFWVPFVLVVSLILLPTNKVYKEFFYNIKKTMIAIKISLALISVYCIYDYYKRGEFEYIETDIFFGLIGLLIIILSKIVFILITNFISNKIKK